MQGPNQKVIGQVSATSSKGDKVTLAPGSFVKAVRKCYLARETIEAFGDYDEAYWTAAYSQHGMILLTLEDLDWRL